MIALEARSITYRYPSSDCHALDGLSLRVREGCSTGLLGPNGAGKTTLVSIVCGLLTPEGGDLHVFGMRCDSRDARRSIGYCPQELALYPKLTAAENLRFFGRLAGLSGRYLSRRIDICLEISRLMAEADTRAERFSGGMKRRLNLGLALIHAPRLLILDEPTVGVDTQSRNAIFEALEELSRGGTTIVYATHYMEEVERLCEDAAVIDAGRVVAAGSTAELVGRGGAHQSFRMTVAAGCDARQVAASVRQERIKVAVLGAREFELSGTDLARLTAEVSRLTESGVVATVETHRPTLEERFLELTGGELRD